MGLVFTILVLTFIFKGKVIMIDSWSPAQIPFTKLMHSPLHLSQLL